MSSSPEPFTFLSPTLGEAIEGHVQEPADETVGVLFLLHGRGGTAADWLPVLAGLDLPPLVTGRPDAPWSERASWYVDSAATDGWPVEQALVADLVPAFDCRYPALAGRERRLVGGVSMGGAGALRLALAHPQRFGALLSLSPAIYPPPPPEQSTLQAHGAFGRGTTRFDPETYRALHHRRLLASARGLPAFIGVGEIADLADEAETVAADLAAEHGLPRRSEPRVWNGSESEHRDGRVRFVILEGGSGYRTEGSDWYFDGGEQDADFSAKLVLPGAGLARSSQIGFRCAIGLSERAR